MLGDYLLVSQVSGLIHPRLVAEDGLYTQSHHQMIYASTECMKPSSDSLLTYILYLYDDNLLAVIHHTQIAVELFDWMGRQPGLQPNLICSSAKKIWCVRFLLGHSFGGCIFFPGESRCVFVCGFPSLMTSEYF